MNNLITFYTDKSFLIFMFLSFISRLKCYPAERLHLFKLTWGKCSSVRFALYYQCYCLNPVSEDVSQLNHDMTGIFGPRWDRPEAWRPGRVKAIHFWSPNKTKKNRHQITTQPSKHYVTFVTSIKWTVLRLRSTWWISWSHVRDYYLLNIHISSKYLTAVLYNVLMAYFVKVCYNI